MVNIRKLCLSHIAKINLFKLLIISKIIINTILDQYVHVGFVKITFK